MEPKVLQTPPGSDPDNASNIGDAEARTVRVSVAIAKPVPAEVPVGADVPLQVKVSCAAGSDLRGGCVNILAQEQVVASRQLIEYRDGCNETDEFAVRAPDRLGEFSWTLFFPRQQIEGIAYLESSLPVSFRTRPHRTSLAVWEVPSPVLIGDRFRIKVGAKKWARASLAARTSISLTTGAKIGHGTLGDTPLAGTSALLGEIGTPPAPGGDVFLTATIAAQERKCPMSELPPRSASRPSSGPRIGDRQGHRVCVWGPAGGCAGGLRSVSGRHRRGRPGADRNAGGKLQPRGLEIRVRGLTHGDRDRR
jgi:hypothetical protein